MPYRDNCPFEKPKDNQKIWHYLNFKDYSRLLDSHSLIFTRSDLLGDKFEGSISRPEMELRRQYRRRWIKIVGNASPQFTLDNILERDSKTSESLNKGIFINCWHMNQHESNAMWKIYSKKNKGIAIQSTYMKLRKCLDDCKEDIFIGKVLYKDLSKDISPPNGHLRRIIRKEMSFAYEQELRAVIIKWVDNLLEKPFPKRFPVSVDLDLLIDGIVVNSTSSSFIERVRSVTKKHNLRKKVVESVLASNPQF